MNNDELISKYRFNTLIIYSPKREHQLLSKQHQSSKYSTRAPGNDFNFIRRIKRKLERVPHTHSYIFEGFYNAAIFLGLEVYWVGTQKELENIASEHSLLMCEGSFLPDFKAELSCSYIVHSIPKELENICIELAKNNRLIHLDVFKIEAKKYSYISDLSYFDKKSFTLFQPWATDLMPNQIKRFKYKNDASNISYYIGLLYEKGAEIGKEINKMLLESINPIELKCVTGASHKVSKDLIQKSSLCIDIRYSWHQKAGYIPCRVFKTLSYGREIFVNSKSIKDNLSYIPSIKYYKSPLDLVKKWEDLCSYSESKRKELEDEITFSNEEIKNKHTYVNRLLNIFTVFCS